jgi:multiple sugar transport system substrate-binding protein
MKRSRLVAAGAVAVLAASALPLTLPLTANAQKSVSLRWRTRPDNKAEADVYAKVSTTVQAKIKGVTLKYEPGGSEGSNYQDQLRTEIAAGTAPDVFWIPGTDVADFAKKGLISNLRPLAKKTKGYSDANYYDGPMKSLSYSLKTKTTGATTDSLWGLPRDVSTFGLYLNLDLISQAGAADPRELAKQGKWDWAAFNDVAKKVSAVSGKKGFGMNAWWANYGYFMNAAGGGFFNADRTACAADSAQSIAGLTAAADLYKQNLAVPYGEDSEPPFNAGNVGMFINGRWATPGARTNVKFNWDVAPLPSGPAGPSNWLFWGAYVVNAKSKNQAKAWELVNQLTQADVQGQISALGANIPSRKSPAAITAFLGFSPPANNQAFIDGITKGNVVAEGPLWAGDWPAFSSVIDKKATEVLKGTSTVDQFKNTICAETKTAFQG